MAKGRNNSKEVQQKADAKRAGQRTRNWTFFVYPDSAPENWRDVIDGEHIEWIESPLHDKDIDANGEAKKPHWHVLVMYEIVKTFEQVKELTDRLNAPIPQKCGGVRGLVRYMAHLDSPDKAQYDVSDIVGHGGADVASLLRVTASERYQLVAEMIDYVDENNIVEMEDLVRYARHERFGDWFPLLCDNSAYVMGVYVKSRRHRRMVPPTVVVDSETGEVL